VAAARSEELNPRWQPVFIGPVGVGKSTVSTIVAEVLGERCVQLDEIAMEYYRVAPDFDPVEHTRLSDTEGFVAAYRYWEPAVAYSLERFVAEHTDAVLDLGAGHTCFLDRSLADRAQAALEPFTNVVLLLPDEDPDVSAGVIRRRLAAERDGFDWMADGVDFVHHWLTSDQNRLLADHVVYAHADPPDVVAERVIRALHR
jgi:hypothetical protein